MQIGFDVVATVIRQLRIVIPVPQEEILQVKTICIRLGLIVILHLGNLILGCHLQILISRLCNTEIANLVGYLVGDLYNCGICKVILAMIQENLICNIGLQVNFLVCHQALEFCKECISKNTLESLFLRLPE